VTVSRLKPTHYDVSLFDLELGGSWTYKGTVKIEATVVKPTKKIVLNTNDISVGEVEVQAADGLIKLALIRSRCCLLTAHFHIFYRLLLSQSFWCVF
jgi:hypothetical protein